MRRLVLVFVASLFWLSQEAVRSQGIDNLKIKDSDLVPETAIPRAIEWYRTHFLPAMRDIDRPITQLMEKATSGDDRAIVKDTAKILLSWHELDKLRLRGWEMVNLGLANYSITTEGSFIRARKEIDSLKYQILLCKARDEGSILPVALEQAKESYKESARRYEEFLAKAYWVD